MEKEIASEEFMNRKMPKLIKRKCIICGKEFHVMKNRRGRTPFTIQVRQSNALTCSRYCATLVQHKKWKNKK